MAPRFGEGAGVLRRRAQPFTGEAQSGSVVFAVFSSLDARNSVQPTLRGREHTEQARQAVSLEARAEVACPKDDATSNRWAHSEL